MMKSKVNRHRPKIVVIGWGTGLPVILNGLRQYNVDITAVVTVADDGGSSGVIRDYINVVPPGDIRNVLVALSDMPEIFDAVQELSELMKIQGHVYPASDIPLTLNARFTDGTTLAGESHISAAGKTIEKVWVTSIDDEKPEAKAEVVQAIMEADQIVLGPGSLFTSILPNLMIDNVGRAVCETKAEVVYICNIMTQKGETEHFTDAEHVRVLNRHLGQRFIDTVLVNTEPVPKDYMDRQKYDEYLYQVAYDFNGLREQGCRVISDNFLKLRDRGVFHDGEQVVKELMRLLGRPKSWYANELN